MLAPRKKLWSTPTEVIERAIDLLALKKSDVVCDIGAGDGRFLLRCMETTAARGFGVEIDEDRAQKAVERLTERGIGKERCEILIKNALEVDFSRATAFFLYLVPRGLRLILPLLCAQLSGRAFRIVTYMSRLEGLEPTRIEKVEASAHPGSQWPLFYYEIPANFQPNSTTTTSTMSSTGAASQDNVSNSPDNDP